VNSWFEGGQYVLDKRNLAVYPLSSVNYSTEGQPEVKRGSRRGAMT
jgi:hypothetical protein